MSSGPVHYVRAEQAQLQAEQAYSDQNTTLGERLQRDALIHALLAGAAAQVDALGQMATHGDAWTEVTS